MYCSNCGFEINDDSKFCSNCGYSIVKDKEPLSKCENHTYEENEDVAEPAPKTTSARDSIIKVKNILMKNRKISIIIGCITIILIIVIISATYFLNTPIHTFERALNSGDYKTAVDTYNSNKSNTEFQKKSITILDDYLVSVKENFLNEELSPSEAVAKLNPIKDIKIIDGVKTLIDNVEESRNQYKIANSMYSDDKLYEAIKSYKHVISEDTQNFKDAQAKIKEITSKLKKKSLAEAEKKAKDGDYKGAAELLLDINTVLEDKDIKKKHDEYFDTYKQAAITELKSKISVVYDDINRNYIIVPKGISTRYVNIGYNRNIEPRIILSGTSTFAIVTGFQQDDWIFTENIKIDCDGTQYDYDVAYEDRNTQVIFGGGIAEWVVLMHDDTGMDELADMTEATAFTDLSPLINSIRNSSSVRIRFTGEGYKDVTIPYNQCQEVGILWDVFKLLEQDGSVIEQLK
ncbi:MAG: zinc ribbon domain-containing protein [Eubacteriales bacterium]|nr:zinc ribbon domain-containing protein [Eubacteriales bacterium]